jgi:hypothetical protein
MTKEDRKHELAEMLKSDLVSHTYNLEQEIEELKKRELAIWKAFGKFCCEMTLQANNKI